MRPSVPPSLSPPLLTNAYTMYTCILLAVRRHTRIPSCRVSVRRLTPGRLSCRADKGRVLRSPSLAHHFSVSRSASASSTSLYSTWISPHPWISTWISQHPWISLCISPHPFQYAFIPRAAAAGSVRVPRLHDRRHHPAPRNGAGIPLLPSHEEASECSRQGGRPQ